MPLASGKPTDTTGSFGSAGVGSRGQPGAGPGGTDGGASFGVARTQRPANGVASAGAAGTDGGGDAGAAVAVGADERGGVAMLTVVDEEGSSGVRWHAATALSSAAAATALAIRPSRTRFLRGSPTRRDVERQKENGTT